MTYYEWSLVYSLTMKYGYRSPMVDLGGVFTANLADYDGDSGVKANLALKSGKLWDALDPNCECSHDAEKLAIEKPNTYGTVISTSVLEHVDSPFTFFDAVSKMLLPGGLAIISTVQRWPIHGDIEGDHWRFNAAGLHLLASKSGLTKLESGYRTFKSYPDRTHVWIACSKGELANRHPQLVKIPETIVYQDWR